MDDDSSRWLVNSPPELIQNSALAIPLAIRRIRLDDGHALLDAILESKNDLGFMPWVTEYLNPATAYENIDTFISGALNAWDDRSDFGYQIFLDSHFIAGASLHNR